MKTNSITIRLTDQEKDLLKQRSENQGMSLSDYVKYCCLQNPPRELNKSKN